MPMIHKKRVIVIGSGPGGYVAAIRASQLGAEVVLVEKNAIGGTCLNHGCIPTKVFLHASVLLEEIENAHHFGVMAEKASLNWELLMKRKREVVEYFITGISSLLKAYKIQVVLGKAELISHQEVQVTKPDGEKRRLNFDSLILALGSKPALPPIPGIDLPNVLASDDALSLTDQPKSLLIIGGGVIGVEIASAFAAFGTKVTIVEALPEILPNYDPELTTILRQLLSKKGIEILTQTSISRITSSGNALRIHIDNAGNAKSETALEAEKVLVCTGRKANINISALETLGIKTKQGRIVTNDQMQTSVPGIFAIGDCCSPMMLAHVASAEGEAAAENALGGNIKMHYSSIPSGVYTLPELASVGISEAEALQRGLDIKTGRFPLSGNGKAVILNQFHGMIKVIADSRTGEVYGAQMLGPRATDIVTEIALAMRSEATVDELMATVHAHPTISEGIREAVLDIAGRGLHVMPVPTPIN